MQTIGSYAFYGCNGLTQVVFPDTLQRIENYAFLSCSQLTSVDFGDNSQLTGIGSFTFYACTSLTEITIPSSVTTIGSNAFSSCSQLTSVDFGDNCQLESIGFLAFRYCELLEITIPSSVTSIEIQAFLETGLTTVTIESETIYNSATSSSACGRLLQYATAVRVLADFARDDHEYINLTNYTSVDKKVVIDGKTYWVYTK